MSTYPLNIITDNDSRLGYETNGPIKKIFNIILTPILNNFPPSLRGLIKKTHHSAKKVIEKATLVESLDYKFSKDSIEDFGIM